jgi:hypothetical protein
MASGYCANLMESKFFIPHQQRNKALVAVKALPTLPNRSYMLVPNTFRQIDTLEKMLAAWGFETCSDDEENIVGIKFVAAYAADELYVLGAIAPYVKAGSYHQFQSRDGYVWRWEFDGATCKESHSHSGLQ